MTKPIRIALYNRHEVKTKGALAPLVQEIRAVCEPGEDSKKVVRQVLRAHGLVLGPALANDPGPEYTFVVSWNEGGHTTINGTARLRRRKG